MKLSLLFITIVLVLAFPCLAQPTITNQPQSQIAVAACGEYFFQVGAVGSSPLSYQWYKDGVALSDSDLLGGSKSSILYFPSVFASDAGSYSVVVSNASGTVTSSNAVLTVLSPAAITTQPTSVVPSIGGTATFNVVLDGTPPFNYQWLFNGANISGATKSFLTITNVTLAHVGGYRVRVFSTASSCEESVISESETATLSFLLNPKNYVVLTIVGPIGGEYRIDYLNDLQNTNNWITLTNITLTSSPYLLIDTNSPDKLRRFYRAVLQ